MAVDPIIRKRHEWVQVVMHDGNLTPATRVVAYEIARHLNRVTGDAWPSQETLARNLGINIRTVERAVFELRGKPAKDGWPTRPAYIAATLDGRSYTYVLCFNMIKTPDKMSSVQDADTRQIVGGRNFIPDNLPGVSRQIVGSIPDNLGGLSLSTNSSKNSVGGGSVTAELRGLAARLDREAAEGDGLTTEIDPIADAWVTVKDAVVSQHGEEARRYLDQLSAHRHQHDVMLLAKGSFTIDVVNRDYRQALTDAWRGQHPWVRDVRLRVGSA